MRDINFAVGDRSATHDKVTVVRPEFTFTDRHNNVHTIPAYSITSWKSKTLQIQPQLVTTTNNDN